MEERHHAATDERPHEARPAPSAEKRPSRAPRPSEHPASRRVSRPITSLELALPIAVLLAAVSFHWSRRYHFDVCDDALISLRYAWNAANGNGLTFNPGERVEGYTNFLWVIVLAALEPFTDGAHGFVRLASALSILLAAVDVVLLSAVGRLVWGGRLIPTGVALLLLLADDDYTVWPIQALEGPLVVFWMLLGTWLWWNPRTRHRGVKTGLCLAALAMTRPDASLFAIALVGSETLDVALRRRPLGPLIRLVGTLVVSYGAYFAWRYGYYGALLPNTFYVKAGGLRTEAIARGLEYVGQFLEIRAWVPLLALLAVPLCKRPIVRTCLSWLLLHVAFVIWVGGDFYPGARFLVVTIPVLGLLLGAIVDVALTFFQDRSPGVARGGRRAVLFLAAVALLAVTLRGLERGPSETEVARWGDEVHRIRATMEYIGQKARPGASIVTGDIGSSGFYARLHVYDVFGIIDPDIAHQSISHFANAKIGHAKRMSTAAMLTKKADYVKDGYFPADLYRAGYYFDSDYPAALRFSGIWRLDDLGKRGRFLPEPAFHFGPRPEAGWSVSGTLARQWTTNRPARGQLPVTGNAGYFLSTYHPTTGDRATGTIRSPPFTLIGDLLCLRIAGGRDAERLAVSLWVDGERVRSATGHDSETFARTTWNVGDLRGKQAELEVLDRTESGWGHLMVDSVRQWSPREGPSRH